MVAVEQIFLALGDPTRRGIVERLRLGEATVSELVARFDLTQPTISSHLKVLESVGLISRGRKGQTRPCRLEADAIREVERWLGQFQANMERNYKRLDRVLDEMSDPKP